MTRPVPRRESAFGVTAAAAFVAGFMAWIEWSQLDYLLYGCTVTFLLLAVLIGAGGAE